MWPSNALPAGPLSAPLLPSEGGDNKESGMGAGSGGVREGGDRSVSENGRLLTRV
jgi:hypothetical protein